MSERRANQRIEPALDITVSCGHSSAVIGRLANISLTGCLVWLHPGTPTPATMPLTLTADDRDHHLLPLAVKVDVVWSQCTASCGLWLGAYFIEQSPQQIVQIASLVNQLQPSAISNHLLS